MDSKRLIYELEKAHIQTSGCNDNGIVWDENHREIQTREDIQAIIANITPEEVIQEPTIEEQLFAIENDKSLDELNYRVLQIEVSQKIVTDILSTEIASMSLPVSESIETPIGKQIDPLE